MEFPKEGRFQLASTVVVGVKTFEYFIETFEEECPKPVQRSIIADGLRGISGVMMVGSYDIRPIELQKTGELRFRQSPNWDLLQLVQKCIPSKVRQPLLSPAP